jgi:hypothetical protein
VAVNAGNRKLKITESPKYSFLVMYFLPLRILFDMKHKLSDKMLSQCYEVYSREMLNLHLGQALDIAWHSPLLNRQITEGRIRE